MSLPTAARLHALALLAATVAACAPGNDPTRDAARDAAPASDTAVDDDAPATPDDDAPSVDDTLAPSMDATADDSGDMTPDLLPDGDTVADAAEPPALAVGGTARVTASSLNLRTGPSTSDSIITSMPCGTQVALLAGPTSGWWNVRYATHMGWSSGAYLVADSAFDPSTCMPAMTDAGAPATDGGAMPDEVAQIFQRARYAVGYSYYWGHGSWRTDGASHGSCSGSCPSCSHSGQYGADCSGFVAKVWQVPSPSPLTTDLHPYSTSNFYNESTHWTHLATSRSTMRPADALVYNNGSEGHIMLFESGSDPWGNIWTYEARGCATGVVHNLRVASSTYHPIRREGL